MFFYNATICKSCNSETGFLFLKKELCKKCRDEKATKSIITKQELEVGLKEKLEKWDETTMKPIIESVGQTISTAGIKGVISPVVDIAGGTVVSFIENGSDIYCAYQEAVSNIKKNKEQNKSIRTIDKKIIKGVETLYDQMVDIVLDQSEPLTIEKLREVYMRVQLLNKISVTDNTVLKDLDSNFKALISTLPDGRKLLGEQRKVKVIEYKRTTKKKEEAV